MEKHKFYIKYILQHYLRLQKYKESIFAFNILLFPPSEKKLIDMSTLRTFNAYAISSKNVELYQP